MDKQSQEITELIKHIPARRRTEFTNYFINFPELIEVYKKLLNDKRLALAGQLGQFEKITKEENAKAQDLLNELAEIEE